MSIERLYYSVQEVGDQLGVSYPTIVRWLGDYNITVKLTPRGNKRLTGKEVEKLRIVKSLITERGMRHFGVKQYLKTNGWTFYGR